MLGERPGGGISPPPKGFLENGGKMTGMDVLEFRDINGLDISVNIHRRDKFLHSNLLQFEFLSQ